MLAATTPVAQRPPPSQNNAKHEDVFMCVFDLQNEMQSKIYDEMQSKIYTDQIDKFPVQSGKGHQYIMVLINMDSSYISMEPMKTRHASQIVMSYQIVRGIYLSDWYRSWTASHR